MELLKQIQKELIEVESIKKENEHLKGDKKRMSQALYDLMLENYNNKFYAQRAEEHIEKTCCDCRYRGCNRILPTDILKPIISDNDFIPGRKCCKDFEWD